MDGSLDQILHTNRDPRETDTWETDAWGRQTDTRDTEASGLPGVLHRRGLALRMAAEGHGLGLAGSRVALASGWEEPSAPCAGWVFPPSCPVVVKKVREMSVACW